MARFPKVGEWGSIEYTDYLGSETFPKNTELPNDVFLTFSTSDNAPKAITIQNGGFYRSNGSPRLSLGDTQATTYETTATALYYYDYREGHSGYSEDTTKIVPANYDDQTENQSLKTGYSYWDFGLNVETLGEVPKGMHPIINYNPKFLQLVPYITTAHPWTDSEGNHGLDAQDFPILNNPYYTTETEPLIRDGTIFAIDDLTEEKLQELKEAGKYMQLRYFLQFGQYSTYGRGNSVQPQTILAVPVKMQIDRGKNVFSADRSSSYATPHEIELANTVYPWLPNNLLCGGYMLSTQAGHYIAINNGVNLWRTTPLYNPKEDDLKYLISNPFGSGYVIENDFTIRCISPNKFTTAAEFRRVFKSCSRSLGLIVITKFPMVEKIRQNGGLDMPLIEENPDSVQVPKIDKNGKVTEDFDEDPDDIKDNTIWKMGEDGKNPFDELDPFDPEDVDTNDYVDEVPINRPTVEPMGKANTYYAMSGDDVEGFMSWLYSPDQSKIDNIKQGLYLYGENPLNFICSLRQFPFKIDDFCNTVDETIHFGSGVNTGIIAKKITSTNAVIDLGSCKFPKMHGTTFLNYEPYTTAKLYIPYCDEVSVNPSDFVGHKINVKMIVDYTTGDCCAIVYCDKVPYTYANGHCAVEIPITAEDANMYVENAVNFAKNTIGAVTGGVTAAATKDVAGVINAGVNLVSGVIDYAREPTPIEKSGTSTPYINFWKPQNCYFIISTADPIYTGGYGDNIGYAVRHIKRLGDCSGLVVCENVHNITPNGATAEEVEQIKSLLQGGVYL